MKFYARVAGQRDWDRLGRRWRGKWRGTENENKSDDGYNTCESDGNLFPLPMLPTEHFRNGGFEFRHRRHEPISPSRYGLDEARGCGRVTQHIADLVDRGIQAVIEFDKSISRPQSGSQLVAAHDLAGPFDQERETAERLVVQFESQAA